MDFGAVYRFVLGERAEPISVSTQAAIDSAVAAASAAQATWAAVGISGVALILTAIAAYATWSSLTTWRNQTVGEKEFNALIETYQVLYDIKAEIHNMRLTVGFQGQASDSQRSQTFRKQIELLNSKLLSKTVGLDLVWGQIFIDIRKEVEEEIRKIALASNMVYESNGQGVLEQQYHLMNRIAPRTVSHPTMINGPQVINFEQQEISKNDIIGRSDAKFKLLEDWISQRLSLYTSKKRGSKRQ